jgi:hypothetical protein
MNVEFVDRYTGMTGIPRPWRACAPCQALGIDIVASTEERDVPCPVCSGSRRRPLSRSLLDIPWRVGKALRFAWHQAVRAEFMAGYPHLSRERMHGRLVALKAMLADFV